jgi:hypothetical protein
MVSCVVDDGSSNADSGIADRSRRLKEEACSRAWEESVRKTHGRVGWWE